MVPVSLNASTFEVFGFNGGSEQVLKILRPFIV
jgi:hypothetical protein